MSKKNHSALTSKDRATAYHKAGHGLAGICWGGNVVRLSIVATEDTLGRSTTVAWVSTDVFTQMRAPRDAPTRLCALAALRGRVRFCLAGLAAEELISGERPEVVTYVFDDMCTDDLEEGHDLSLACDALRAAHPNMRRAFWPTLEADYLVALEYLTAYRKQLDALAAALLEARELDKDAMFAATGWLEGLDRWEKRGLGARIAFRRLGAHGIPLAHRY